MHIFWVDAHEAQLRNAIFKYNLVFQSVKKEIHLEFPKLQIGIFSKCVNILTNIYPKNTCKITKLIETLVTTSENLKANLNLMHE